MKLSYLFNISINGLTFTPPGSLPTTPFVKLDNFDFKLEGHKEMTQEEIITGMGMVMGLLSHLEADFRNSGQIPNLKETFEKFQADIQPKPSQEFMDINDDPYQRYFMVTYAGSKHFGQIFPKTGSKGGESLIQLRLAPGVYLDFPISSLEEQPPRYFKVTFPENPHYGEVLRFSHIDGLNPQFFHLYLAPREVERFLNTNIIEVTEEMEAVPKADVDGPVIFYKVTDPADDNYGKTFRLCKINESDPNGFWLFTGHDNPSMMRYHRNQLENVGGNPITKEEILG